MPKFRQLIMGSAVILTVLLQPNPAKAETKVIVNPADGSAPVEMESSAVTSIKFPTGKVDFLTNPSQSWLMKDVMSIKFKTVSAGINEVAPDNGQLTMRRDGDLLIFDGLVSHQAYRLDIYSLTGALVHSQSNYNHQPVDISFLPSSLYIVKINNSTFKFVK